MRAATPCKRCGGEVLLLGAHGWCMKPSVEGGCGGLFHEIDGKWKRTGTTKVAPIEPIVKTWRKAKPVPCPIPTEEPVAA